MQSQLQRLWLTMEHLSLKFQLSLLLTIVMVKASILNVKERA